MYWATAAVSLRMNQDRFNQFGTHVYVIQKGFDPVMAFNFILHFLEFKTLRVVKI